MFLKAYVFTYLPLQKYFALYMEGKMLLNARYVISLTGLMPFAFKLAFLLPQHKQIKNTGIDRYEFC